MVNTPEKSGCPQLVDLCSSSWFKLNLYTNYILTANAMLLPSTKTSPPISSMQLLRIRCLIDTDRPSFVHVLYSQLDRHFRSRLSSFTYVYMQMSTLFSLVAASHGEEKKFLLRVRGVISLAEKARPQANRSGERVSTKGQIKHLHDILYKRIKCV